MAAMSLKEGVIIVHPEESMSLPTEQILQARDIKVMVCSEAEPALEKISSQWNGVLLIYFDTPVAGSLEFLARIKQIDPDLPVLMILDHAGISLVVSAMRMGTYDVIQKPLSLQDILKIILGAPEKRRLVLGNRRLQPEIGIREIFQDLLGRDWPGNVRELKNVADRFALGYGLDPICPGNREESPGPNGPSKGHQRTLVEKMDAFEKILIGQELARTKGNVKETYLTLGLPRKTFYDKLNKHGLKRKDFVKSGKPSDDRPVLS